VATPRPDLFRAEAIESYRAGHRSTGDLLRISPGWTGWCYWLLLGVALAGMTYLTLGTVHEYAAGPAVVRVESRTDVTARLAGTVSSVDVHPGQRVATGDVLVQFHVAQEIAELERLTRELALQIINVLRDPADRAARQALTTLRADRTLAEARLDERIARAPHAGTVSDVRIRAGQQLTPGEIILSLIGDDSRFSVIAMLPGDSRPLLTRGLPLRLELSGYRYAYQDLLVETIGDEVVGPAEVRRYLGQEIGDSVPVRGPIVLVTTSLPSRSFVAEGRTLQYYDGMQGTAEARVREETILFTLVPGLKALFGYGGA